jgi:AraC family transcriptional activator FtrA
VADLPTIIEFMPRRTQPHLVVALALPGVVLLDLAAPSHVFGHCGAPHYAFRLAGERSGPVPTSSGYDIVTTDGLEALDRADTVVVPGFDLHRAVAPEVLDALRGAHSRGARIMSVCIGAFLLAQAGLLEGLEATTHWQHTDQLARQYSGVRVNPDVLYVDQGSILTSAGVAAGIDLCLHVARLDLGAEWAANVARRMVVAPHRSGGQAQFIELPVDEPQASDPGYAATRTWALAHLDEPLDVPRLARHAMTSPRTFARRFRQEVGMTPARWLTEQRIVAAQRLLERTDLSVDQVATRTGFGSPTTLREHFARHLRTTPTAYRRQFGRPAA